MMYKFGLKEKEYKIINDIFKNYGQIEEVVIFGSRALNTFKTTSDIDFAIKGEKINSIFGKLKDDFEESSIIFEVDIVDYENIKTEKLLEHIDRFGVLYYRKGWYRSNLGEIINVVGGGTPRTSKLEYWNGNIPWLSVVDFNNDNRWVSQTEKSITELGLNSSSTKLLDENDLIISARGTVGALAQLKTPMAFNQSCYGIKPKAGISDINYLFYLIKYSLKIIGKNVHGAVFDTITRQTFDRIECFVPEILEQKSIADILSSFDDKIELLREQNKVLESTAQTIFKEWFVNCPNSEYVAITKLIEFNPIEKIDKKKEYLFFDMKTVSTNSMATSEGVFKQSNSGTSFRVGDTLFAKITPCLENGKTAFVLDLKEEIIARGSTEFIVMRAKKEGSPYLNYCISRNNNFRDYAVQSMTGTSGRQRVPIDRLKDYKVKYSKENIRKFNDIIEPVFEKIKNNIFQIRTLSNNRDILLPKLMSGEVRVIDET